MNKRHKGLEDNVRAMMHEVEAIAKEVRATVRKRAKETGLTRNLNQAAKRLRAGAAKAALQVEKYAHALRTELEAKGKTTARRRSAKR